MAEVSDEPRFRDRIHVFNDRFHAGELLADKLTEYRGRDAIILAIPAGGVPVGYILAKRLNLQLDLILVRKLHIPWNPEAGFGAITWDGIIVFNEPLKNSLRLTKEEVDRCIEVEKEAIERRMRLFRGDKPFPDISGKTVILVDDGLASGFSMLAALMSVSKRNPKEKIVAVPTASYDAIERVRNLADRIICLNIRKGPFFAVADAYKLWYDLEEDDVKAILDRLHTSS